MLKIDKNETQLEKVFHNRSSENPIFLTSFWLEVALAPESWGWWADGWSWPG